MGVNKHFGHVDLGLVEQRLTTVLDDLAQELDQEQLIAGTRLALEGGKRLRPALTLGTFASLTDAEPTAAVIDVACAWELLHACLVVHDDVIDDDVQRRGKPTVRAHLRPPVADESSTRIGDAGAIIVGDLLLSEAYRLVGWADIDAETRLRLGRELNTAIRVSARGEWADVVNSAGDVPLPEILRATREKTAAYSVTAPLASGAILAGASEDVVAALRTIGGHLGSAYQLCDDLIGTFGSATDAGRLPESDLREKRATALIALAREEGTAARVEETLAAAHTGAIAVAAARAAISDTDARTRVEQLIAWEIAEAEAVAREVPEGVRTIISSVATLINARIPRQHS